MQNEDNLCLKYILNELEPSEVMMLERALEENEDLLIEVESLRATLNKLEKLDEFEPPEELCDSIINKAAEYQNRRSNIFTQPAYHKFGSLAAAFLLVVIIFSFSNYRYLNTNNSDQADDDNPSINASLANGAHGSSANNMNTTTASGELSNQSVSPWIDNNEVLRFEDKFNKNRSTKFDSAMHNSFKKLVPVTYSTSQKNQTAPGSETPIQLTGSYQK